jgi:hypothetical protein
MLGLVVLSVIFVAALAGPAHSQVDTTTPVCSGTVTVLAGHVNGGTQDSNCEGNVNLVATVDGKIADTRGVTVMSIWLRSVNGGIVVYLNTKKHDQPILVAYLGFKSS